ncbi:hypothetical protein RJT30_02105 (plasmid) [Buchnera aphidicola (Mollitrichosiphum nigrofasciatum)]|uniref:hypothetical protein n=1 Tax=Buchnera aphidicola TaxID=9 RepID=UPI0031B866D3
MNTANKNISVQQNLVSYHKDPTLIFRKLCYFKPFTLLLESAEIKNKAHLKSMLIVDSAIRITAFKNIVYINSLTKNGYNFLKY